MDSFIRAIGFLTASVVAIGVTTSPAQTPPLAKVPLETLVRMSKSSAPKDLPSTPPAFPAKFLNSGPLHVEGLRGKAVMLLFAHSDDEPGAPFQWVKHFEDSQAFQGQPVILITVISNRSESAVRDYLKRSNVSWPTIVDEDGSYARASGIPKPIDCKNHQARVISPTGEYATIGFFHWARELEFYSKQAKWRVEPSEVPSQLKPAWQMIEIGNYNQAASLLSNAQKSTRASDREAIDKLKNILNQELSKTAQLAEAAETAGNKWTAYKHYYTATLQFSNFAEAKDLKAKLTKLTSDPQVSREIKAAKLWTEAQSVSRSPNAATQKRGIQLAQQVVKEFPNTEAATAAQAALDSLQK